MDTKNYNDIRKAANKKYYYKNREKIIAKQSEYRRKKRTKTDEELKEMGRDSYGRFLVTSGNQKYKQQQINGERKQTHVAVWEKHNNKKVPKGWHVHHKDGNTFNNDITNLEAMPAKEHFKTNLGEWQKENSPWNKGKKCPSISEKLKGRKITKKQLGKVKASWFNKYLDSNIKIWQMKDENYLVKDIAKELNITTGAVTHRWKSFKNIIDVSSGRLI